MSSRARALSRRRSQAAAAFALLTAAGAGRSVLDVVRLALPRVVPLARAARRADARAGRELVREGDDGDRFFVVADGELDVLERGERVAGATRGAGIGEIALLRDVPRTATVVARTRAQVLALAREPFLAALAPARLHAGSTGVTIAA